MSERKIFEYSLQDAWNRPISGVTILGDQKNTVLYSVPQDEEEIYPPPEIKSIEISNEAMNRVKSLIADSKVYEIDDVEDNRDVICLDGYVNAFYVSKEKQYNSITVFNLGTYRYDTRKYPKACKLIKLLKDLSKVLVPEGVDKRCFNLE